MGASSLLGIFLLFSLFLSCHYKQYIYTFEEPSLSCCHKSQPLLPRHQWMPVMPYAIRRIVIGAIGQAEAMMPELLLFRISFCLPSFPPSPFRVFVSFACFLPPAQIFSPTIEIAFIYRATVYHTASCQRIGELLLASFSVLPLATSLPQSLTGWI